MGAYACREPVDPLTNKRKVIPQPPSSWVIEYVPELQIVPDVLWDKAQKRQHKARPLSKRISS